MQVTDEMVDAARNIISDPRMRAALEAALRARGSDANGYPLAKATVMTPADADLVKRLRKQNGIPSPITEQAADCIEAQSAEIARLREALGTIIGIENRDYGPDWEEIEEAREIARAALETKG